MKKRLFALLCTALMVLTLVGCENRSRGQVEVPDLVGMKVDEALKVLTNDLGLKVRTISTTVTNNDDVGKVIGQEPAAKSLVLPKSLVILYFGVIEEQKDVGGETK